MKDKKITACELKAAWAKDMDRLAEQMAAALNSAQPGRIINDSEEPVRNARKKLGSELHYSLRTAARGELLSQAPILKSHRIDDVRGDSACFGRGCLTFRWRIRSSYDASRWVTDSRMTSLINVRKSLTLNGLYSTPPSPSCRARMML